jgi:hypothetical protein
LHEIERFLLDPASLETWRQAEKSQALLDQRWSITELWSSQTLDSCSIYGKATLIAPPQRHNRNLTQS